MSDADAGPDRHPLVRAVIAVIAGTVSAMVMILVIETLGHLVVPVADAPRLEDAARMREYLAALPASAYAFVLAAYAVGCYAGGVVASRIAPGQQTRCAWLVGALILAATLANLVLITHPAWFVFAAIAVVVAATWLAGRRPAASSP